MSDDERATIAADEGVAPRCLNCGYCLIGLVERRCPECARPFDLTDPSTFSTKPPLIRWRFWLPGLLLAIGAGLLIFLVIFLSGVGIGWGATLAAPVSIGVILGYRCRVRPVAYVLLVLTALVGIFVALFSFEITGLLCSVIAFVITFGPMLLGAFIGLWLRVHLKQSAFSERFYLPMLLICLPILLAIVEDFATSPPARTGFQSSRVLHAPADLAWRSIRYYEELSSVRPLLFTLGAPQPVATHGSLSHPGDLQVCKYRKGRVLKRLRTLVPGRRIVFDVVEQTLGFERSVRLAQGSFWLEPVGANATRLSLQTDYDPLLRPRWCWAPFERYVLRTLHEYILDGIEQQATQFADALLLRSQFAYDVR